MSWKDMAKAGLDNAFDDKDFVLAPALGSMGPRIIELALCRVILADDRRFPWLILVPRLAGLRELYDLDEEDQLLLTLETNFVARVLADYTGCDKINVASIGNVESQLHQHVVGRFKGDDAWPAPIWGVGQAQAYAADERDRMQRDLLRLLG